MHGICLCKHLASRFSLLYRYDSVLLSAGAWAVHWVAFHWVSRYVVVLFFFFPCFFFFFVVYVLGLCVALGVLAFVVLLCFVFSCVFSLVFIVLL